MEETMHVKAYLIYLPIAVGLTYYVAKALFKNSKVFMMDIFKGREEIALSTNKIFEIGFYLLNLGFALLITKIHFYSNDFSTIRQLFEVLTEKIGGFSIYLGAMLFINLFMFFRGKKKAKHSQKETIRVTAPIRTSGK